ncbi:MAG: anti-sigma F factor antagonist [Clostridia bacterium]|nr:anti-sigma F factor antagonist [Clostridia bacterium]
MTKILINNNLVVKLIGEIDHSNSNKYRHEIDDEIKRRPVRNLIFDFKDLDFMDSSGIGMILGRYKTIKGLDGVVMIASPKKQVEKIINVSGLHKIIPVYESVDKAINSMREVAYNG